MAAQYKKGLSVQSDVFHVTTVAPGTGEVDMLYMIPYNVRNVRHLVMVVSDAATGEIYAVDDTPFCQKTYYDDEEGWSSYAFFLFDGTDITEMSITDRAKMGISFAFQQPVRFKGLQVLDLIRLASGNRNLSVGDACEYLSAVGLCARDYIRREVNASLSGGELKRIEIATVLARKTRLSVFDEPEAGIDLWSFQNLIQVFERMRKDISDSSIMIISHQERILNIADEIVVLADGKIRSQGPKEEVLPELIGTDAAVNACQKLL